MALCCGAIVRLVEAGGVHSLIEVEASIPESD